MMHDADLTQPYVVGIALPWWAGVLLTCMTWLTGAATFFEWQPTEIAIDRLYGWYGRVGIRFSRAMIRVSR